MIYEIEMNYILELLKCAVTVQKPSAPPEGIDWDTVYLLARSHKICSTLYFGMQKLSPELQQHIKYFDRYLLAYKKTLVQDANKSYELKILKDAFEKNNIDYIFLKGSVTRYLYPDTSMRVMNDIDIFYRGADANTIKDIFLKNGYHIFKKEPKEISFFKPTNEIKIEMQTALIDESYTRWFQYLKSMWDKCVPLENLHEYKMTNEDFYIYHIIHMAKHFKHGGIGLIHVLDVWVMINSYSDMNWTYIAHELQSLGLDIFDKNLRLLVSKWFGESEPLPKYTRTLSLMENYIFTSGAFGKKSQQEINAIVERNDKKISIMGKIFPDLRTMVDYYGPLLKKYPILLPFYWIRLNFKRIFFDRKKLKNSITIINNISDKHIESTKELMKRCGF